jgi:hypothetical protein
MEEFIVKVSEFLSSAAGASATIAVILEFAFRLLPSKKPLSVLHVAGKFARAVGEILVKVADFLDKVLPQHIKEEQKEEVK